MKRIIILIILYLLTFNISSQEIKKTYPTKKVYYHFDNWDNIFNDNKKLAIETEYEQNGEYVLEIKYYLEENSRSTYLGKVTNMGVFDKNNNIIKDFSYDEILFLRKDSEIEPFDIYGIMTNTLTREVYETECLAMLFINDSYNLTVWNPW